jgi:hypothetical protein
MHGCAGRRGKTIAPARLSPRPRPARQHVTMTARSRPPATRCRSRRERRSSGRQRPALVVNVGLGPHGKRLRWTSVTTAQADAPGCLSAAPLRACVAGGAASPHIGACVHLRRVVNRPRGQAGDRGGRQRHRGRRRGRRGQLLACLEPPEVGLVGWLAGVGWPASIGSCLRCPGRRCSLGGAGPQAALLSLHAQLCHGLRSSPGAGNEERHPTAPPASRGVVRVRPGQELLDGGLGLRCHGRLQFGEAARKDDSRKAWAEQCHRTGSCRAWGRRVGYIMRLGRLRGSSACGCGAGLHEPSGEAAVPRLGFAAARACPPGRSS